jgi:putative serine protease PepD
MSDQVWDPWSAERTRDDAGKAAGHEAPEPDASEALADEHDTIDLRTPASAEIDWSAPSVTQTDELWSSYNGDEPPPREGRSKGLLLLAVALAAALLGGAAGAGAALYATRDDRSVLDPDISLGAPNDTPRDVAPESVAGIAARLLPSVVSISVGNGAGSGVILRADGYILTNNHVVEGAQELRVTFASGKSATATIVGTDPLTDLAVIKANATGLPPATLGRSSNLRVGDPVVAVGSPLGLEGTVTSGIVSALNRQIDDRSGGRLVNLIQTDAAINPGNSGGALADAGGNLIGINTAIASTTGGSIGLGFAIPMDEAISVAEQIIRTGRATHPYLGVGPETLTPEAAQEFGVESGAVVASVFAGGPAAAAGIETGDVIVKFGDDDIGNAGQLITAIRKRQIGEVVDVTYVRDGDRRTTKVTLAERPTTP